MELRLDGKVALVTGGSRGIGRATAAAMAASGARVMIASRKADVLAAAAAEIPGEVDWFVANAGDPVAATACADATVERFGAIDILVNNAATNPYHGPLMGLDVPRAEKTVQVNQLGIVTWTQCVWRASMAQRGGSIINIASIGGIRESESSLAWYGATKAAAIHLTKSLAAELAPYVRVNAVAPGVVKTDMARALWEGDDAAEAEPPLRRFGEPDDVAGAVVFLASEAASWITGSTLVVDGGALLE